MAEWTPAANVPGLIPAAARPAAPAMPPRPAPAAGVLLEATPAAPEAEYEEEPPGGIAGMWANLSSGAKTGIIVGGGGALVVFLFVIVLIFSGALSSVEEEPAGAVVAKHEPVKEEKAKEEPSSTEVLQHYEFDPKSLSTASQKAAYELGMTQGGKIIAREYNEETRGTPPSPEKLKALAKKWLEERDVAIHMGVVGHGRDSDDAITLFGRRDGAKAWLKEHGAP